jgi:two-component system sensor histidine kinase/response regulator
MKILDGISKRSRIALLIAGIIMMSFFLVQTCIIFGVCPNSYSLALFGYICVICFIPPFFLVVKEFMQKTKTKHAEMDNQLRAIDKSNLVVTLDIMGNVLDVNDKFSQLVKYNKEELIGVHHSTLCSNAFVSSKEYHDFWEKLRRGEFVAGEFERVDKNGKKVWLFGTYTPLSNEHGQYTKVLKIAVDVTERYKYQELLRQKSVYLEHAAKIIRHDMHSGINTYLPRGIKGLKRRLSDEDIERLKIKSPIQLISDGLHHAQKVYAGVYEFTNLVKENTSMSTAEYSIKDILDDYLKLTAYKNQVILDDNLPIINVNQPLFCTAIDNLIRNGLKYNDSGTKWVKIYNEDKYICIEDNGRGLSQSDFDKLSEPYTRKKNQKESGTGLGLNICVQILNEHGFTIISQKTEQGTKLKIKYQNND